MSDTPKEFYLDKSDPAAWAAFGALSKQAGESARAAGLDDQLIELVCLRISQINGCAYCLKVHTKRAIKAGLSENRRALVSVWEESSEYSLTEKAALFLAETVTKLPCPEDRDFARTYARGVLTDEQYSAVQWLAISMNATFENPLVAERNKDGRGAYEIFADSSGTPTTCTRLSGCAF